MASVNWSPGLKSELFKFWDRTSPTLSQLRFFFVGFEPVSTSGLFRASTWIKIYASDLWKQSFSSQLELLQWRLSRPGILFLSVHFLVSDGKFLLHKGCLSFCLHSNEHVSFRSLIWISHHVTTALETVIERKLRQVFWKRSSEWSLIELVT